jgi:uncharacterized membrane protein
MSTRNLGGPAIWLGVALGGFFDGIVLHQILQWHHLLSAVQAVRDLRLQLLADGLFHALMYVVAAVGLVLLWRRRALLGDAGAGRVLASAALAGFGGWHVLDAVVSHWLTGIHRVRMDVANPPPWDIGWVVVFGLLPLAMAAWLWRRRGAGPGDGSSGRGAAVAMAVAALVAGPLALWPAPASDQVVVVFSPGVPPAQAFNALARHDARVLWADGAGGVWAVQMADTGRAWRLYADGALWVGGGAMAMGCLSWMRAAAAS